MLEKIAQILEGSAKAVSVDVNAWWKLGFRIAHCLEDAPMDQLKAWGKTKGLETVCDPVKETVTFTKKCNNSPLN